MPASNKGEGAVSCAAGPPRSRGLKQWSGKRARHGRLPARPRPGWQRAARLCRSGLTRTGGRLPRGARATRGVAPGPTARRAPATGAPQARARVTGARPARARATQARARPARARVIEARPAVRAIAAQDRTGAQLATGALPRPVGHNRHGPARESGRHEPPKGGWDRPGPRRMVLPLRVANGRPIPASGQRTAIRIRGRYRAQWPEPPQRAATSGQGPLVPRARSPRAPGRRVSLPQAGEPFALRPRDARPVAGLLVALTGLLHPLYGEAPSVLLPSAGVVVSPRARAPAAQPGSGASSAATRWRDARRSASFLPPAGARYTRSG